MAKTPPKTKVPGRGEFILQIVWGIFASLVIVLVLVLVLTGCKNTGHPQPSPAPNIQSGA